MYALRTYNFTWIDWYASRLLLSVIYHIYTFRFEIPDQSMLILLTKMIYDRSCRIFYARRPDAMYGSSMFVRIFVHIIPR